MTSRRPLPYLALLLVAAVATGCSDHKTYRLKYAYNTPPWKYELERYSDFKYEVRKVGATEFITFLPKTLTKQKNGSIRAEYLIELPMPQPGELYEMRSSFKLDGKPFDGELRREVLVAGRER